jgi:hypothetical protein
VVARDDVDRCSTAGCSLPESSVASALKRR